jgi:hypothetical protein
MLALGGMASTGERTHGKDRAFPIDHQLLGARPPQRFTGSLYEGASVVPRHWCLLPRSLECGSAVFATLQILLYSSYLEPAHFELVFRSPH